MDSRFCPSICLKVNVMSERFDQVMEMMNKVILVMKIICSSDTAKHILTAYTRDTTYVEH